MSALLENAPCGFLTVDENGMIVYLNTTLCVMLGYTPAELQGQHINTILPAGGRIFYQTYLLPMLKLAGALEEVYVRLRAKDAADTPVLLNALRRERERAMLTDYVVVSMRQRRQFEDDLARAWKIAEEANHAEAEARAEADRANRAKSEFLASMSHELRTPLNTILGFTGTLLMRLPGPLTADQDRQLTIIKTSARHLLALINDILDLAKIEAGKVTLTREPVLCQAVLEELAASLRPLAEQKGLAFRLELPAAPLTLISDRRALSQIVLNLVGNAIKFTDTGEVQVRLERRETDAGAPQVCIAVRDTGIGIRPEDQARLFQAFEQVAPPSGGGWREGTGLGLRLAHKLAELLGGSIALESAPGVGSTFTLTLPLEYHEENEHQ
ncbi:PAS domain-containing sensor histidine kinase [Kouleothrix sp.]|uniref:sensor histidine kinase n=1 Tax=Kouleothrix sp. TaxID=2779161 RepID=UPI00391C1BCC